ncbi:MAG: hypothetical protein ACYTEQ_31005 [Planctomycetota bacterium]
MSDEKSVKSEERDDVLDELRRRLKAAREKNEAFEEQARSREEKREIERRLRFEENKNRDLPKIQAAEDEHVMIRVVNTPDGAIVVKRPHHLAYQKFVRKVGSDKGMNEMDVWKLVKPCIVYPDVSKVEDITEEEPAKAGATRRRRLQCPLHSRALIGRSGNRRQ